LTVVSIPILVVEDDLDMQFLIESVLAADPRFQPIVKTTNAYEAIALVPGLDPGLIILDHQIEGEITGFQAAPMLKAVARKARIIIFTTHDLSVEVRQEPAIDLYVPKKELRKLLTAAQNVLGLPPIAQFL
jgi:CheY-like chemotaxis protein